MVICNKCGTVYDEFYGICPICGTIYQEEPEENTTSTYNVIEPTVEINKLFEKENDTKQSIDDETINTYDTTPAHKRTVYPDNSQFHTTDLSNESDTSDETNVPVTENYQYPDNSKNDTVDVEELFSNSSDEKYDNSKAETVDVEELFSNSGDEYYGNSKNETVDVEELFSNNGDKKYDNSKAETVDVEELFEKDDPDHHDNSSDTTMDIGALFDNNKSRTSLSDEPTMEVGSFFGAEQNKSSADSISASDVKNDNETAANNRRLKFSMLIISAVCVCVISGVVLMLFMNNNSSDEVIAAENGSVAEENSNTPVEESRKASEMTSSSLPSDEETKEQKLNKYLSNGDMYLKTEDYVNAIDAYQLALNIDPDDAEIYKKLFEAYSKNDNEEKALNILDEGYKKTNDGSLKEMSDDYNTELKYKEYIRNGDESLNSEDFETAESNYSEALKLKDDDPELYIKLADAYIGIGDNSNASEILKQGYEITENDEIKWKLEELPPLETIYLETIEDLIDKYGEGEIIADAMASTAYRSMNGLGIVRLIDFDGDGSKELMCVVSELEYDGSFPYRHYNTVFVYKADGDTVEKIYEGTASGSQGKPFTSYTATYEKDDKILLLNYEFSSVSVEQDWSELSGDEFEEAYTLSMDVDTSVLTTSFIYEINGKSVTEEAFNKAYDETINNRNKIMLSGSTYDELSEELDATYEVLDKIGYVSDKYTDRDSYREYMKIYEEYISDNEWRSYINFASDSKKPIDNTNLTELFYIFADIDSNGVPEMWLYANNPDSKVRPETHTLLLTIEDGDVKEIISDNSIDGTIGGGWIRFGYDTKTKDIVICDSVASSGVYTHNVYYTYEDGSLNEITDASAEYQHNAFRHTEKYMVDDKEVDEDEYSKVISRFSNINYNNYHYLFNCEKSLSYDEKIDEITSSENS